jgi:hypothetical protein
MTDDPEELPMAVLHGLIQHGTPVNAAREAAGITIAALAELTGLPVDRIEQSSAAPRRPSTTKRSPSAPQRACRATSSSNDHLSPSASDPVSLDVTKGALD